MREPEGLRTLLECVMLAGIALCSDSADNHVQPGVRAVSMRAGSGECAAVDPLLGFVSQGLQLIQSCVPLHSGRHTSYDDARFKCLSSEASGSSNGTHSGSGSSEDVADGGGAGGCCFFGVSSAHPSVNKALLVDPLGPASAVPAVVSRALHHTQPLNGIVNPFEVVANAGYGSDVGRLERLAFGGIRRAMHLSAAAWGDEASPAAAQLPSVRTATAGLLPAPGSTVLVVRSGVNGLKRGAELAKAAAVMPQSPFAAVPASFVPGSAEATSADGAQSRPVTDASRVSSNPGASAAGETAGAADPAQLAGGRTSCQTALIAEEESHPSDTLRQATRSGEQQQVKPPQRGPQPPPNPFADVRGMCNPVNGSAASDAGSVSQRQQPAASSELPVLGGPDADWAWPVHRADDTLSLGASGVAQPVDSPFGAVGSGVAPAAQRRGARCHLRSCLLFSSFLLTPLYLT